MAGGGAMGNRAGGRKIRPSEPALPISGVARTRSASSFALSRIGRGVGVASRPMGGNASKMIDFAATDACCCSKTMNKEEIFSTWAPDESPWSRWAKPVLFAYLDSALSHIAVTEKAGDVGWVPVPGEKAALALDLPGAEGVVTGIALAGRGYWPVPLYNAVPLPISARLLNPLASGGAVAAVDVLPIISALRKGAEQLAQLNLPFDAPPAFLLDANRQGWRKMIPGEFDNRSVSFTTDFPSANFLAAQGIERVILVQKGKLEPQPDLAHTLRRWQD